MPKTPPQNTSQNVCPIVFCKARLTTELAAPLVVHTCTVACHRASPRKLHRSFYKYLHRYLCGYVYDSYRPTRTRNVAAGQIFLNDATSLVTKLGSIYRLCQGRGCIAPVPRSPDARSIKYLAALRLASSLNFLKTYDAKSTNSVGRFGGFLPTIVVGKLLPKRSKLPYGNANTGA